MADPVKNESPIRAILRRAPVIAVYGPASVDEAVHVGEALLRGGLPVIEVTLRTPVAIEALAAIVKALPDAIVGAGADGFTELRAIQHGAGAKFVVSPGATPELLAAAAGHGVPLLPGVQTASEVMAGLAAGLDTFKFFPAVPAGGVAMLRAFAGPFPQVCFCPTGGITPDTAAEFLALPNVACVGGSWLTPKDTLASGDWATVERHAREASGRRG